MDAIALAISAGYRLSRTLVLAATKDLRVLRSQVSPLFRKFYSESLDRTTIVSRKYSRIVATTSRLSGIESENKMTRGTRITYTIGARWCGDQCTRPIEDPVVILPPAAPPTKPLRILWHGMGFGYT